MVCMFLPLGGTQCNIVILVFCLPLWSEGMEVPCVHRLRSEGCGEVVFGRAAAISTSSTSVWPFVCIHSPLFKCYARDPDGESTGKEVTNLYCQTVSRHDCHLDLLTLYHTCSVLHPSHSTAPRVRRGRSGCCRFAGQWGWWVFERSFSSVNGFGTCL